jgi:Zn-dependent membrane protease YugP
MKNTLKNIKNLCKKVHPLLFIGKNIEDILILSGLIVIIKATFLLSKIGGMYCLGAVLLALGIFFTKYPIRRR